jgi:hypothetical protein
VLGVALKLGDVIEVDDRNYRFGIGPLILRVTTLGQRKRAADGEWLDLEGLELRRDGSQISEQPRPVSVRLPGVRLRTGPYAWS